MKTETLPVRLDLRSRALRDDAQRGDEQAVTGVARAARAMGVADEQLLDRLTSSESGEEMSGDGLWDAVQRFLTNTKVHDRARTAQRWQWPLFVLSCPEVAGAQTEVVIEAEHESQEAVSLKLFGAGFESATTLTISDQIAGTASPGDHRLLFAGHDVEVVDFDIVRGGRVISQGTRLELVDKVGIVGWLDLPCVSEWLTRERSLVSLQYSQAKPSTVQQWSRKLSYSREFDLVFGPDFKPLEFRATLAYELATTVNFRVSLPGGDDWDVVCPQRCAGALVISASP